MIDPQQLCWRLHQWSDNDQFQYYYPADMLAPGTEDECLPQKQDCEGVNDR